MPEVKAFLEKVHIKNYLSLREATLPLKPLTVLVGPNASGKSNVLNALSLTKWMMFTEKLPRAKLIREFLWAGEVNHITFRLLAKVDSTQTDYQLVLKAEADNPVEAEELSVNGVNVISIRSGKGKVWDENGANETRYHSNKLALRSAGDYGNKPITNTLTAFIKGWNFYDFQPGRLPSHLTGLDPEEFREFLQINDEGSIFSQTLLVSESIAAALNATFRMTLKVVLSLWHENDRQRFDGVSESLRACTNLSIDCRSNNGDAELFLLEGYEKPIPLERASDGTLRLIAYHILLNQINLPQLIAIEEPERNLHPGALTDIANVLEQLSERTQVIITTHSSQLLDAFNPEKISESLGVLLLRNRPGQGTEVINLEEIRGDRAALDGWITDFGIGSAIFESELLQDLMED